MNHGQKADKPKELHYVFEIWGSGGEIDSSLTLVLEAWNCIVDDSLELFPEKWTSVKCIKCIPFALHTVGSSSIHSIPNDFLNSAWSNS